MKTLSCDLCDFTAEGETFEAWMENLKPHYAQAHLDFMMKNMDKSEEEKKAAMNQWMNDNRARFEAL